MTAAEVTAVCERLYQHWAVLGLKTPKSEGKPKWTDKKKDWAVQIKKESFEAVKAAIVDWFSNNPKVPTLPELLRSARRRESPSGRQAWAAKFQHGDILVDPANEELVGILEKDVAEPWLHLVRPGEGIWRASWVVLVMRKDLAAAGNLVLSRLELCPVDRAAKQLIAWQEAYAKDVKHWHNDPPWYLFEPAERLLKQRS